MTWESINLYDESRQTPPSNGRGGGKGSWREAFTDAPILFLQATTAAWRLASPTAGATLAKIEPYHGAIPANKL